MKRLIVGILAMMMVMSAVAENQLTPVAGEVQGLKLRADAIANGKKPQVNNRKAQPKASETQGWMESFEGCTSDISATWLPAGWTRIVSNPDYQKLPNPYTWFVSKRASYYAPEPPHGEFYAEMLYNSEPQDEWLITDAHVPGVNDALSFYVQLLPFNMFDYSKWIPSQKRFSEYIPVYDFKTYISVEGADWEELHSLADYFASVPVSEIVEPYYNAEITTQKVVLDMQAYAGKSVRFAFRYVGQDGDSMWLDCVELAPANVKASYAVPEGALFMGMTADFERPVRGLFLPDGANLTWTNTSSLDATEFEWEYPTERNYNQTTKSTSKNLVSKFSAYVPDAQLVSPEQNVINVPTITVSNPLGSTDTFTHPIARAKVGGKARLEVKGTMQETGASTCDPDKGEGIALLDDGTSVFGVSDGTGAVWTALFGLTGKDYAYVKSVGNYFYAPEKAYTLRSTTVQVVGKLENVANLRVTLRHLDNMGEWAKEPLAIGYIDKKNVVSKNYNGKYDIYSLTFVFEDPVTVNEEVWVVMEGISEAFSFMAPLQTIDSNDEPHGCVEVDAIIDGQSRPGLYSIGNLTLKGNTFNNSFFFNLNVAYGDHDDWGHIDMQDESVLDLVTLTNMHMDVVDAAGIVETDSRALRCGFYDESNGEKLTLYAVVGQLYEKEGDPYYSDELNLTSYIKLTVPRTAVGKKVKLTDQMEVKFYDARVDSWSFTATMGEVEVTEPAEGMYYVALRAYDKVTNHVLGAQYQPAEAWRWRDYNEPRPEPNEYTLKRSGEIYEQHELNSCVVDMTNAEVPMIYLTEQAGVDNVSDMQALSARDVIRVAMPMEYCVGRIWGFSTVKDDRMTVYFDDEPYNYTTVTLQNHAMGGNVKATFDTDAKKLNIEVNVMQMEAESKGSLSLRYKGTYSDQLSAVSSVKVAGDDSAPYYDLMGRRFNQRPKAAGIYIQNGNKIQIK